MTIRYRGRIPVVDPDHPEAWAKDDITGLPVMHGDMIKQMEYIGNGLAWTGFMVHHKDADQPNPQLIPPRLKPDPVPIDNPRYLQFPELPPIPTGLTITSSTANSITVTWTIVPVVPSYVVGWASIWSANKTGWTEAQPGIIGNSYTITGLSPGNTYNVSVASTADNSSLETFEFTTSAFSSPVSVTLPYI